MDLRRPVPFALLTLASFLVARWLGVGLHEVAGHGLAATLAGGSFYGVYVSPVTGFALLHLPPGTHDAARVLVVLAGILVELVLGLVVLLLYPRIRSFAGRIFALALLEILLVYSFAYVALGAFSPTGGDPGQAAAIVGAPHLRYAFLVVGILWSLGTGYAVSTELIRLVAPSLSVRRQLAYFVLFWTVPLPLAAIPNLVSAFLAPSAFATYVLLVLVIGAALVFAGVRISERDPLPPMEHAPGRLTPLVVAALLVVPAWYAFGLSSDSAERLLLGTPPLGAERALANPQAVNVRVILTDAEDVVLEFRMKGVPDFRSPLERQAFATFEDRADFSYWIPAAARLAVAMMNATSWMAMSQAIDRAGTVWFDGGDRPNPRLVTLALERPEQESRFLNVTQNGTRTFLAITILDPFRNLPVECPGCFLDELNLSWAAGGPNGSYTFVSAQAQHGTADDWVAPGLRFARYRANTFEQAPELWRLVLEIA